MHSPTAGRRVLGGRRTLGPVIPLPAPAPTSLHELAEVLQKVQFTPAGLRGLWGVEADAALQRNNAAPARWQIRGLLSPRAVLAGLFVLAVPQPTGAVEQALGTELTGALRTAGLLMPEGDDRPLLASRWALTPYAVPAGVPRGQRPGDETIWLFSDHGTLTRPDPVPGDFVLGLGGAGRTLAETTPRQPVASALDLGTGCGIQAVLLARHAVQVVATDVSARALHFAAMNAQLNHVASRIEFRCGSLFGPAPESFDLVVSNPPFVITPQGRTDALQYRDGGLPGDVIMRTLLEQAPHHLNPDGHAAFLGNWELGTTRADLTGWVQDAGTSLMVIERERLDPAAYAETWIRDGGVPRASARWNADTEAWLSDLAAREVETIGLGWLRLHRASDPDPTHPALRHCEALDQPLGANPLGVAAHLDTRLAMLEWLAGAADAELAATAFILSGDVTEHRHFIPGQEAPTMITIEQGTGFARTFASDPALSGFIGVADGSLTLQAVSDALAKLLAADAPALQARLISQVRILVPAGVLYPAL